MQKKLHFTAMLVVFSLFFCGCGPASPAQPAGSSGAKQEAPYVGTWIRQAIYTNGQLVSQVPSTLVITPTGTFFSINDYGFDEGTITVTGDVMNTVVTSGMTPGQKVSHQFTVSEDGQTMTFIIQAGGAEMREVYKRKQ